MKTIELQEAYNILRNCSAVIVDNNALVLPCLDEIVGNDENEFLYLGWSDEEGLGYSVKFAEGGNRVVKVSGYSMILTDNEGDECHLVVLEPRWLGLASAEPDRL